MRSQLTGTAKLVEAHTDGQSAIAFGIGAVALPSQIMFGSILDVIFGQVKRDLAIT